jgi:hypothetical protein
MSCDSKTKGALEEVKQFYKDSIIFLKQCEKPDAKGKTFKLTL